MDVQDFELPQRGNFEFDFLYFGAKRPDPSHQISEEDFQKLCGWFVAKKEAAEQRKQHANGNTLGDVFSSISEYFVFDSRQLVNLVNLIESKS